MELTTDDRSLPADIMFEILTRSSIETIACCRILSKEWNRLTYEPTFKNILWKRTNAISGFFLQSEHGFIFSSMWLNMSRDGPPLLAKIPTDILPPQAKIEASTRQGIILFSAMPRRFYVCKPTEKQRQEIPDPKTPNQTEATGLIVVRTKPLHYKIVRLSKAKEVKNDRYLHCELFDSQIMEWEELPQVKLPRQSLFSQSKGSVLVCGSLHWLTYRDNILAFRENNQSWSLFSFPEEKITLLNYTFGDRTLLEYRGKLGCFCMAGGSSFMEVLVMECYEQKTWSKTHIVDLEFFTRQMRFATPIGYHVSGIVLMKQSSDLFVVNPQDASYVWVKTNDKFNPVTAFQFESDSEIPDLQEIGDHATSTV